MVRRVFAPNRKYKMPSRATERINFGKIKEIIVPPNMIELQTNSYAEFLQADLTPSKRQKHVGLESVFREVFPIESYDGKVVLDYTPTRVLRRPEAFDKIPSKELPTILAVTLQDDGVGVPPQLTTGSLHKLVGLMREHGLAGFCTRQWMISDLDPSVAYLAKAAWDAGTTPETTSRDLIRDVCGESAVGPMLEAFSEIETVTAAIEDHGLGVGFPVPSIVMGRWTPDGFPKEFAADREGYRRALADVQKVASPKGEAGAEYIRYWTGRLEFGVAFFDTLESVAAAATAEKAATDAKQNNNAGLFAKNMAKAAKLATDAQATAFKAIDTLAKVAKNQSDRGTVATLAEYMYRPLKRKAEELIMEVGKTSS